MFSNTSKPYLNSGKMQFSSHWASPSNRSNSPKRVESNSGKYSPKFAPLLAFPPMKEKLDKKSGSHVSFFGADIEKKSSNFDFDFPEHIGSETREEDLAQIVSIECDNEDDHSSSDGDCDEEVSILSISIAPILMIYRSCTWMMWELMS